MEDNLKILVNGRRPTMQPKTKKKRVSCSFNEQHSTVISGNLNQHNNQTNMGKFKKTKKHP
jgi:hypothetical protein